jgi:hypothetical protein
MPAHPTKIKTMNRTKSMAQQDPRNVISLFYKDPSTDNKYYPVERSDQLQAINKYLTTGTSQQSVPHYTGQGMFEVTFKGAPKFFYTKSNGTHVEIMFSTPNMVYLLNRVLDGGSRHRRTSKRTKKVRHSSRRHRK